MAEFTKGEWKVYQTDKVPERYGVYVGEHGEQGIVKTILDVSIPSAEKKANINLIAAAPKMYEALRKIVEEGTRCVELMQQDKPIREIYNIDEVDRIARQALAKAEGKE